MNVRPETAQAICAAEVLLCSAPQGELDPAAVEQRVRAALQALAHEGPQWISLAHATRLLGVLSDDTPLALVRLGLLRGRARHKDEIEVRLDDVLRERMAREDLLAIGGDDLTPEELEMLHEATPGTNPWEREQVQPSA